MNQDNISGSSSETNIPPETAPGSQSYVYPAVQPWALVPAWALNSQQPTTFMAPVPANTTLIKSMDPYFMHVLKQHPVVQAEVQDQAASTENTGIGNTENESEGKEETSSGSTHVNDGMPKVFSQTSYQLSRNEPGHFSVDFCEHEELMSDRASTLRGCFNGIPTELKAKFKKELIEGNLPFELQNRVRQNVLQKIKSMLRYLNDVCDTDYQLITAHPDPKYSDRRAKVQNMDMSDFFKEFQSAYSHATRLPPYHFENMLERLLSVHRDSFLFENDSGSNVRLHMDIPFEAEPALCARRNQLLEVVKRHHAHLFREFASTFEVSCHRFPYHDLAFTSKIVVNGLPVHLQFKQPASMSMAELEGYVAVMDNLKIVPAEAHFFQLKAIEGTSAESSDAVNRSLERLFNLPDDLNKLRGKVTEIYRKLWRDFRVKNEEYLRFKASIINAKHRSGPQKKHEVKLIMLPYYYRGVADLEGLPDGLTFCDPMEVNGADLKRILLASTHLKFVRTNEEPGDRDENPRRLKRRRSSITSELVHIDTHNENEHPIMNTMQ